jgi:hypothetical protein
MTALAGLDRCCPRAPSSAYIATDSRISWVSSGSRAPVGSWDRGRNSSRQSCIRTSFGFVGDAFSHSLYLASSLPPRPRPLGRRRGTPPREAVSVGAPSPAFAGCSATSSLRALHCRACRTGQRWARQGLRDAASEVGWGEAHHQAPSAAAPLCRPAHRVGGYPSVGTVDDRYNRFLMGRERGR